LLVSSRTDRGRTPAPCFRALSPAPNRRVVSNASNQPWQIDGPVRFFALGEGTVNLECSHPAGCSGPSVKEKVKRETGKEKVEKESSLGTLVGAVVNSVKTVAKPQVFQGFFPTGQPQNHKCVCRKMPQNHKYP